MWRRGVFCFSLLAILLSVNTSRSFGAEVKVEEIPEDISTEIFSVSVPISLPVNMLQDGTILCDDNVKIINNSMYDVSIKSISIVGVNDWTISSYDVEIYEVPVGTKTSSYILNGDCTTDGFGDIGLTSSSWSGIGSGGYVDIDYNVKIPAQHTSVSDTIIAKVVFVVEIDSTTGVGNNIELEDLEDAKLSQPSDYVDLPVESDTEGTIDENKPGLNETLIWLLDPEK